MDRKESPIRLVVLLVLVSILASLPVFYVIHSAGSSWRGIMPPYVTDAIFYMPKLVKGTASFPFGNNPFLLEHVKDINATPSVADYVGSLPLKLGFSLPVALIFNSIFWHAIFAYLCLLLLRAVGIRNNWAFLLVLPLYASLYGMLVKPVVLQIVMPFFMAFLLSLISWLKQPVRASSIMLSVSLAGTLYIYPYTFQIACAALGFIFISYLASQNWSRVILLVKIGLGAFLVGLPAFWYIYQEINHPLFGDMIARSGSIETHLPSAVSFYTGRWIITGIGLWYLILYTWPILKKDEEFKFAFYFIKVIGFGMLIILMSPIITGRDAMIGHHVGREVFFWLSLSLICAIFFLFKKVSLSGFSWKKWAVLALIVINVVPLVKQYKRSLPQPYQSGKEQTILTQTYFSPLSWLDQYDSQPKVIWANPEISIYIPFVSHHYVLTPGAFLIHQYFIEISEIQERYLLARYFEDVNADLLRREYEMPFGAGYTQKLYHLQFKSQICRTSGFILCNSTRLSDLAKSHEEEIEDLIAMNKKDIRPHVYELLKKYNISYAIKDIRKDLNFHFDRLRNAKEVYNDGLFVIYKFGH